MTFAAISILASCIVAGALGLVHLLYTFSGTKFHPRDPAVLQAMIKDSPKITRQTTIWRASLGFNASHSLGVLLFSLVYGYLVLWHSSFLQQSTFLLFLGMALLLAYLLLAKLYWFSVPFRGIALACVLFATGLALMIWTH
jgi:hypothetical protein